MPKYPHCLKKEIVTRSKLFEVEAIDLKFSNGEQRIFERLLSKSKGAVLIIPITDKNQLLLVKEYAAGSEQYELGFPKGRMDEEEQSLACANRELKEEVGFGAKRFIKLKSLSLAPNYFGLKVDVIIALDLFKASLKGDEPEPLEVIQWPIDDIDSLLDREDFSEARSIAAIYLLKQYLKERKL